MDNKFEIGDIVRVTCWETNNVGIISAFRMNGFGAREIYIKFPHVNDWFYETYVNLLGNSQIMKTELDNQTKKLRDEFAMAALPQMIKLIEVSHVLISRNEIAGYCYKYADAMLKAREAISE